MNSTPPASSAARMPSIVRACAARGPRLASSRLMDGRDTFEASAKSRCSQRRSARAARICSLVIIRLVSNCQNDASDSQCLRARFILQVSHKAMQGATYDNKSGCLRTGAHATNPVERAIALCRPRRRRHMVIADAEAGKRMIKWLRTRRETARSGAKDANRIQAKSSERGNPPSDPDPIAEFVRIVGEAHAVDPA